MNKYNMNVLVEAKKEYTKQLISILTPQIYIGIQSIYKAAQKYCQESGDKNIWSKFQYLLARTPSWNQEKLDTEFKRIVNVTECDYIEDLLTAVFVSHTKVYSSIRLKKKSKTIELNVPTGSHFMHKVYIECARSFWKCPFLYDTEFNKLDLQRNLIQAEKVIKEGIEETIRKMLPVKDVLKRYLGNDYNDDEEEEDITSDVSNQTKKNLRKLIKFEIEQSLSKQSGGDDNFSRVEINNSINNEEIKTEENKEESIVQESTELEENKEVETTEQQTAPVEEIEAVETTEQQTTPVKEIEAVETTEQQTAPIEEIEAVETTEQQTAPVKEIEAVETTEQQTAPVEDIEPIKTNIQENAPIVNEVQETVQIEQLEPVETNVEETTSVDKIEEIVPIENKENIEGLEKKIVNNEKIELEIKDIDNSDKNSYNLDNKSNESDIVTRDVTADDFDANTQINYDKISLNNLETLEEIKKSIKNNISKVESDEEFSFFEDAPTL